jgi:hypothetical protein
MRAIMKKFIAILAAYLFLAFGLGGVVRADDCSAMNMMPGKAMIEMVANDAPSSTQHASDCMKEMSQVRCVASCAVPAPTFLGISAYGHGPRVSYKPELYAALSDTLAAPEPFPPRPIA